MIELKGQCAPVEEREVYLLGQLSYSYWRRPIVEFLKDPNVVVDRKTKNMALSYVILGDSLFKKSINGNLLTYLSESEAYIALAEVHAGIYGAHQVGEKMKWVLYRQRVYWPSMAKDYLKCARSCEGYQKHGHIQHVPATDLHPIVKSMAAFLRMGSRLNRANSPSSSKGHKYILVVVDYFTKWVEAIPLKEVTQTEIIDFIEEHIIHRFGISQTLTTNQGTMFTGQKGVRIC